MKFSVIIPTCNRNDLLRKCLDLLSTDVQKKGDWDYEVIVTDDSKENAAKYLISQQYSWARWISGPKRGPAANRNNGAKQAAGEWIIYIDDDCLPSTDIIEVYNNAIAAYPQAGAFEGAILPDDERLLKKDLAECPVNTDGGYFWTANVCIKRSFFEMINGFDEDFILANHEDQILFMRLKEVTVIPFISSAQVVHPVRFVPLSIRIKNNNKKLRNWLIFTEKCKQPFFSAIKDGLKVHTRELVYHMLLFKTRNVLLDIHTLFIGLPILIIKHTTKSRHKNVS